jgi:hypothetical protein
MKVNSGWTMVLAAWLVALLPRSVDGIRLRSHETNRCSKNMDCISCIHTPSCGWCDGGGDADVCIYESQKSVLCANRADDFVGQKPAGQNCPSTLFDGSSALVKAESGFGASGRKEDKLNYPYSRPPLDKMPPKMLERTIKGLAKKTMLDLTAPARIQALAGRL